MSDSPLMEDGTVESLMLQRTSGLRADFESAWEKALHGGPEPCLETYLEPMAEPDRSTLRTELEKLAQEYRDRLARANEQTEAEPNLRAGEAVSRTARPTSEASVTCEFAPDTKVDSSQKTGEYIADQPEAPAAENTTLDFLPESSGPAAPDATIAAADLHTGAFSLADDSGVTEADDQHKVAGYEILQVLGRGAMGVVYKARQRGLKRVVALKMILAGGHASDLELARFRTEAEAVAQLQHPNIVQVYEVGEHNGCPYLSLEYINGGSLQSKLGGTPQPVLYAAQMIQVLAQTMEFAHRLGIIHRDLKPGNVMLTLPRAPGSMESTVSPAPLVEQLYGTPKIADFGLAKRLEEDGGQTRSGTILGTPSYMAPEQAEGKSKGVGPLADQYAIGAMLYEMLTGRPPFRGESVWDTLDQVRTQEPVPPSRLQPKIPADLETICLKALQKEPSRRYSDCAALAEDLRRFVAGETILARPVGTLERYWRWCKRNQRVAVLAHSVFVLLILIIVGLVVFTVQISKARDLALENEKKEEKARKVATEQGDVALGTLRNLVSKVQESLGDVPNTGELRDEILQMAMDGVEKVARSTENQPIFEAIEAKALDQQASILKDRHQYEQSLERYAKACQISKRRAEQDPASDKARGNVAAMLTGMGDVCMKLNRRAEARDYFDEALRLRQGINREPYQGDLPAPEVKLAVAYSYLRLEPFVGPFEVLELHEKALALRKQAVALDPKHYEAQVTVADSNMLLGELHFRLRETAAAREYYQRALEKYDYLRGIPDYQRKLDLKKRQGSALLKLGEICLRLHRPAREARIPFDRAVVLYEGLFRDDPRVRDELYMARYGAAVAAQEEGDSSRAQAGFRKALRLYEDQHQEQPEQVGLILRVMLCKARLGEHKQAAELARLALKHAKGDPGCFADVACGYALCMAAVDRSKGTGSIASEDQELRDRYLKSALELLDGVKVQGYQEWVSLESEPDLAPIQSHPDFRALIAKLQAAHPLPQRLSAAESLSQR
jgi:serine/threonine-protein kinase